MATTVHYHHGLHFCADLESGRVLCDAFSDRGKEYPGAPELLMVSLGSCTGAVLLTYCARHEIPFEGMSVDLNWELAEHPKRIGRINMRVRMPGDLTDEQKEVLKRVTELCMIHATLTHPPEIVVDVEGAKERGTVGDGSTPGSAAPPPAST